MRKRRTRRSTAAAERYLPLVYFGAIVLIAGILLPSALRPPNQQPNQTAQLSPDAPPDKNPDALISSLNRASSGTAGTGNTGAAVGAGGLASPGGPTPPTTFAPRACPKGVGNPPRQVESIYAAPCATPWSGNNGGATWKGVNATEIRVGIRGPGYKCGASYDACHNGPVDQMDPSNMNGAERTFFVLERYFNQSFQLFGRQLRFYFIEPNSLSIQDEQNEAVDADNTYHIFGSPTASSVSCEEWARRQILSYCEELPEKFFNDHRPYVWGGYMSGTEITRFAVEYICKKLAGKPAVYTDDPTLKNKVRKIGVVTYNDRGYGADAEWGKAELKRRCGLDEELIFMNPDEANGQSALATAATKLKADDITTVIPGMDWLSTAALDNAAASQQYYPEWYVCDCGALTRNQLGQLQNQTEWGHSFGL